MTVSALPHLPAASRLVLVSACLLGQPVRYDGGHQRSYHTVLQQWLDAGCVVSLCPEVAGGLPTPRPPAEIRQAMPLHHGDDLTVAAKNPDTQGMQVLAGTARVVDAAGEDVSAAFIDGAQQALALVKARGIRMAVLKENSPSCGSQQVYDGEFRGQKLAGAGVTAALLRAHGVLVFSENQWEQAHLLWQKLGTTTPAD